MSDQSHIISLRLSDQLIASLNTQAQHSGLSRSELLRRAIQSIRIPNAMDHEAVKDLLQVNADQARLGNMMLLVNSNLEDTRYDQRDALVERLASLEQEIRQTQENLKAMVRQIRV